MTIMNPLRKIAGTMMLGALAFIVGCESVALLPREDIDRRSAERRDDSRRDRFDARDEVYGTVQDVDERRREIRVRTEAGRTSIVRYDANTRFSDGSRDLRPDSLRSGDEVSVRFGRDRGGEDYAAAIRVMDRRGSWWR
jgi:hypothetical protein